MSMRPDFRIGEFVIDPLNRKARILDVEFDDRIYDYIYYTEHGQFNVSELSKAIWLEEMIRYLGLNDLNEKLWKL